MKIFYSLSTKIETSLNPYFGKRKLFGEFVLLALMNPTLIMFSFSY